VPGRDLRVRRTHRPGELSRQPSALRPAPPPGPPRGRLHQPGCSAPPGGGARGRLPMSPGPTCPGRVPRTSRGSVARAGPAHPGPRSSPGRGDADNNRCKAHNRRGARVPRIARNAGGQVAFEAALSGRTSRTRPLRPGAGCQACHNRGRSAWPPPGGRANSKECRGPWRESRWPRKPDRLP